MKIRRIEDNSIAAQAGLLPGDDLTLINGGSVRDGLDFQFLTADEELELEVRRNGDVRTIRIDRLDAAPLGIDLEPTQFKHCANKCIFCFIDQNPDQLRPALYFKDEDYRLSFMYGNYITLTNIKKKDLRRIVEQHLSPLYISIHVLDPAHRKYMLGITWEDRLLDKMQYLIGGGITLHGQIVLCPTVNDGHYLEETVFGLHHLYPALKTLSIVPLGLTDHRRGLTRLKQVTSGYARETIRTVEDWQEKLLQDVRSRFVYLSDEFYCFAGEDFPEMDVYEDCEQLGNGVGMCRHWITEMEETAARFPRRLKKPRTLTLVTGVLACPLLKKHLIPKLESIKGLTVRIAVVENTFYGPSITVSGLLAGGDIVKGLENVDPGDVICLPPDVLNRDGLFLDSMSFEEMQRQLPVPVHVYSGYFDFLFT